MAQSTATTATVTSTNGITRDNDPVLANNVVRAVEASVHIGVDSSDRNLYPAISLEIVTGAIQYWIYDLGDTTTRDADLATF
jgi:hypothetical protein